MPVFIAYADLPAARRALRFGQLALQNGRGVGELAPMLWRLDQLEAPRWRDTALREAGRARSLIFSASDPAAWNETALDWLKTLAAQMRGHTVSLLALVGETEHWTISFEAVAPLRALSAQVAARPPANAQADNAVAA